MSKRIKYISRQRRTPPQKLWSEKAPQMLSSSPPPSSYRTAENSLENSPESSAKCSPVTRIRTGRIIVLLGAPCASQLRNEPLVNESDDQADQASNVDRVTSAPSPTNSPAVWRILPLKRKHLHTGFSQQPDVHTPVIPEAYASTNMSYRSTSLSSASGDDDLSRSFAAHNVPSSPVADPSDLTVSFASTDTTSSFNSLVPLSPLPKIKTAALTDLGNLPSANYIGSIKLKMRVSIIVGITHIFPQRTFTPKYSHAVRSKQTLVVGDETAVGFKIDLWLPPGPLAFAGKEFMDTVESLRVGDVINVQNMVLGVWDKQVNGATVRKDQTRIELVYRTVFSDAKERRRWKGVDLDSASDDSRGVEKVKRVVEWTREFLGAGDRSDRKTRKRYEEEETILPDDTQ